MRGIYMTGRLKFGLIGTESEKTAHEIIQLLSPNGFVAGEPKRLGMLAGPNETFQFLGNADFWSGFALALVAKYGGGIVDALAAHHVDRFIKVLRRKSSKETSEPWLDNLVRESPNILRGSQLAGNSVVFGMEVGDRGRNLGVELRDLNELGNDESNIEITVAAIKMAHVAPALTDFLDKHLHKTVIAHGSNSDCSEPVHFPPDGSAQVQLNVYCEADPHGRRVIVKINSDGSYFVEVIKWP
jgi:hypothetical protein